MEIKCENHEWGNIKVEYTSLNEKFYYQECKNCPVTKTTLSDVYPELENTPQVKF